jgi:hypothetical protein
MENTISPPLDFKSLLTYQNIAFNAIYKAITEDDECERISTFDHEINFMNLVRTTLNFHIDLFCEHFKDFNLVDAVKPHTTIREVFEIKAGLIYSLIDLIQYEPVDGQEEYEALKQSFDALQGVEQRIYKKIK